MGGGREGMMRGGIEGDRVKRSRGRENVGMSEAVAAEGRRMRGEEMGSLDC